MTKRILFVLLLTALFAGCSSDNSSENNTASPSAAPGLAQSGWTLYEVGAYAEAIQYFSQANSADGGYADGWIGTGWTLLRLPQYPVAQSIAAFNQALLIAPSSNDAQAGLAFAYAYANRYVDADSAATQLFRRVSIWIFPHRDEITRQTLQIHRSLWRFMSGNYVASYEALREFDPFFTADISTAEGRVQLGARIEEWVRS